MTIPNPATIRASYKATPEFTPFNQTSLIPPIQGLMMKLLTDLSKLYNNKALKFGSEMYDILDVKLKIFYEICYKANI